MSADVNMSCIRIALAAALAIAACNAAAAEPSQLLQAIKSGDRTAALALARQKSELAATEADGTTALHWAVRQDDLELIERLLRAGANATLANRYGVTPLNLAAVNGSAAHVRPMSSECEPHDATRPHHCRRTRWGRRRWRSEIR